MRHKNTTVKLVYSKQPYRDMRMERQQRQEAQQLRYNLAWVGLCFIGVMLYCLLATQ